MGSGYFGGHGMVQGAYSYGPEPERLRTHLAAAATTRFRRAAAAPTWRGVGTH